MRVSNGSPRYRQYAGLALVIIAYVGGIIGWSCAVLQVDPQPSTDPEPAEATHRRVAPPVAAPCFFSRAPEISRAPAMRMRITRTKRTAGRREFVD